MTTETKNIYDVLPEMIAEVGRNKDLQREIEEYLVEHHDMPRGSFLEFLANSERVENTEEEIIGVYLNAVFTITKDEKYDPSNYFASKDLKKIGKYKFEKEKDLSLPITFDGVIRVNNENYLTALSYKTIYQLWNAKIITYNFQTQRLSKKKLNAKGNVIEKADVKTKSVKEIVRLMKEGKYEPSTIIFNIAVDGVSAIDYEEGSLTIHEGSTINVIDGAHRIFAVVELLEEFPDFEGYLNVDIKFFPIKKAQFLLSVTNRTNRFDRTLVKYYGGEEYGQEITKTLMELPVLKNRIEIKTALDKKITITNFAIVSEAIQTIFNPQNSKEKYDVEDILKRFFEYFIPAYEDVLIKNRAKSQQESWVSHHNMFVAFIVIAKKLSDKYGRDFPVNEIVKIVDAIDFNKQTSELTEIMAGQGKSNSNKVKGQIREFFEKKIDQLLK